ncbi:MAG: hypothetical protein J3R72DRAFT_83670 [Linnemannia gamsii]|nr:MAG: hypothetical protein J3R72DRAFT_83670 [Linnemannia gamsii]
MFYPHSILVKVCVFYVPTPFSLTPVFLALSLHFIDFDFYFSPYSFFVFVIFFLFFFFFCIHTFLKENGKNKSR